MMPGGAVTILHDFGGASTDGASPEAGLLQAADGNFYGTTYRGGAFDRGTIFRLTAAGSFTLVGQACMYLLNQPIVRCQARSAAALL
jgi:uncharacterized repeat protein (TIGR03803 family)